MKKSELKRMVKAMSQRTLDEMHRLYQENMVQADEIAELEGEIDVLHQEILDCNAESLRMENANLAKQVERMAQTINSQDKLINKLKGITP